MADLQHALVLEQRLQLRQHQVHRQLVGRVGQQVRAAVPDRNVAGPVWRGREAHPGEPGDHAVEAIGLGIDRDNAQRGCFGDPAVERGLVGDGLIFRSVDFDLLGRWRPGRLLVERRHDVIDPAAAAASSL